MNVSVPVPRPAGVQIRLAGPAELDAAGEVVATAYVADGLAVHPPYLALVRDARSRAEQADVAVAVDATGTVVGSVTFTLAGGPYAELAGPGEAEFRMLGVAPAARGRGVGAALVEWCLQRAAAAGAVRVVLSSTDAMQAAHRLYTRRGFVRREGLDWSPVPGVMLRVFSLDLPPGAGPVSPATSTGSAPGPRPPA